MKTVYLYDESTGEYLREYIAQASPVRQGEFIVPTHSTDIAPPLIADYWPVFQNGSWVNIRDYRGIVWEKSSGLSIEYDQLGDLPSHLTAIPKPDGFYKWAVDSWVVDLDAARQSKSIELKSAAASAITAGLNSNVLGGAHSYPSTATDQQNLNGLVTESLLPDSGDEYKFWCADSNGLWARRVHTKLQIQSLGKLFSAHVKNQQQHYESKLQLLSNAADIETINAIEW